MLKILLGSVIRLLRAPTALSLALLWSSDAHAHATAQTPSISGNWGVALVIALFAVWGVILLVRGVLFLDERDAWLRRGGEGNDYWMRD